jgi:hypothetical protein
MKKLIFSSAVLLMLAGSTVAAPMAVAQAKPKRPTAQPAAIPPTCPPGDPNGCGIYD